MLVDTHCHLDFLKQLEQVLAAARRNQVKFIITSGINAQSSQNCVNLAKTYPEVYATVGLHPIDVSSENQSIKIQLQVIEALLKKQKVVALGETGLDFAPPALGEISRTQSQQINLLKAHINLAIKYKLPLVIHNRKANQELIESLSPYVGKLTGVFHCFTGSKKFLHQILDLGFYIGVGGLITYNSGLQQVIKDVPKEKLLLETDAPYLTPEPVRKKKRWPNEPKNVKIIAKKIAQIRGDSFMSIAQQTTNNAKKLFKI